MKKTLKCLIFAILLTGIFSFSSVKAANAEVGDWVKCTGTEKFLEFNATLKVNNNQKVDIEYTLKQTHEITWLNGKGDPLNEPLQIKISENTNYFIDELTKSAIIGGVLVCPDFIFNYSKDDKKIRNQSVIYTTSTYVDPKLSNNKTITIKTKVTDAKKGSEDKGEYIGVANCDAIFGDPNDPKSLSEMIKRIFNYIQIIGPILVVLLTGVDYLKVVLLGDDEKKSTLVKKLGIRLICILLLIFIPLIVNVLLDLFGITSCTNIFE